MHLRRTLLQIQPIKNLLQDNKIASLKKMMEQLNTCETLIQLIETNLCDEPAGQIGKGMIIRSGFHQELVDAYINSVIIGYPCAGCIRDITSKENIFVTYYI
jgi:DNA mismatch repair ATPase MutS